MKYSRLFGKTQKEAKRGMKFASHQLLYRGGFVRELSAGRYQFLPLGMRVWLKVQKLIDDEMQAIGSQRFSIPILQPMDFWKKTNRDAVWGNLLMKVKDRNGSDFALSATGEAVVTELVGGEQPSYQDLPVTIHQFIAKFRDEERPRGGLLRVREFVMKDAYSYHTSEEDLLKTYQDFYDAYGRLCDKLGLEYYPVIADSGALGGDYCHEFQVPCEVGEDKIVKCDHCDYAANVEMAVFSRKEVNADQEMKEYEEIPLPKEVGTIKELVEHYGVSAENFIKNVVYKTHDDRLIIGTITGDMEVNPVKLAKAVGEDELIIADDADLASIGATHGTVHSWGYEEHKDRITFVVDEVITKARNLYGGYKTDTTDPINVNYGRDFNADIVADIAEPYDGATCAACSEGKLQLIRTVEFGHVFKYDTFYSEKHDGYYTDKDGQKKLMYSGAYGIGLGRTMAVVVEKHHDENGIIWPMVIAPYQVNLLSLGDDKEVIGRAEELYRKLIEAGVEVLWDDRDNASAGEKFADSDLIGIPIRLVVSARNLKEGQIEAKLRSSETAEMVSEREIVEYVKRTISSQTSM